MIVLTYAVKTLLGVSDFKKLYSDFFMPPWISFPFRCRGA